MKIKTLLILSFVLMILVPSYGQSYETYIVINEADWCKYCKANGERIHSLIDEYALNKKVLVVNNNLTNEETKKQSIPTLEKIGVYDYMKNHKETAVVFIFDAESKKILETFTLKTKNEKVLAYLNGAMESAIN